jgi:hypothetical protein
MIVCVDGDDLPMAGRAGERQPKELVSRRSVDRVHQPTGARPAQELPQERLGLGLTDVQADDLTAAALVDAVGDHQRLVPDPAGLAAPVTDE